MYKRQDDVFDQAIAEPINVDNDVEDDAPPGPKKKRAYFKRLPPERKEPGRLRSRVIEPIIHPVAESALEGKETEGPNNANTDMLALLNCLTNIIKHKS